MDGISALCVAMLIYFAAPELFPATPLATGVTLGLLFAFIDYLQRVFVPIREFSGKLATIQRAVASLERIYKLFDEPVEVRAAAGAPDPLQRLRRRRPRPRPPLPLPQPTAPRY
jgi:ATP-binding cassette subfamily B multidrug efflux pump